MTNITHSQGWQTLRKRKWFGRKTIFREGTLRELRPYVSRFKKVPYAIPGEGVNHYLFMIVREPLKGHFQPVYVIISNHA